MDKVKNLGQVFTKEIISDLMVDLISNPNPLSILEPSAGEGIFLNSLVKKGYSESKITAYEIDDTLENKSNVKISYQNFLSTSNKDKYDLIIGNPPYVRWKNILKDNKEIFEKDSYWNNKINGQSDLLYAFIFKCVEKLNPNGELIFITPSFWIQTKHSKDLRQYLLDNGTINLIINFNEMKLFNNVSSNIIIFKFTKNFENKNLKNIHLKIKNKIDSKHIHMIKEGIKKLNYTNYYSNNELEIFNTDTFESSLPFKALPKHIKELTDKLEKQCEFAPFVEINIKNNKKKFKLNQLFEKRDLEYIDSINFTKVSFDENTYYVQDKEQQTLFEVENLTRCTRLGDVAYIGNGMVSGLDKAFKLDQVNNIDENCKIKVVKAADLKQFYNFKITPYIFVNNVLTEEELKTRYNPTYTHLIPYKEKLDKRYDYNKDIPWWHWVFLRNYDLFKNSNKKIFVPCKERIDIREHIRFSYVEGNIFPTQDITAIIKKSWIKEDILYILAFLNSEIIYKWIKYKSLMRGGVAEFSERPLSNIPIKLIDWNNPEEVNIHNNIVNLVSTLITKKEDENEIKNKINLEINNLLKI